MLITSYKQWNLTLLSNKSNKNLFNFIKKNKKNLDFIKIIKKQKDNKIIFFSQNPSKTDQSIHKDYYNISLRGGNILFDILTILHLLKF